MGCDIHCYKEKLVNGKWVSADEWVEEDDGDGGTYMEVPYRKRFSERNYGLFGLLCDNVRTSHPLSFAERGMPEDASIEVEAEVERWDCDGHSHSYLSLQELKDLLERLDSSTVNVSGMMPSDRLEQFQASMATESPDYDLMYPYCKWTTLTDWQEFSVTVPASQIMGGSLQRLIKTFEGVDGDDQRLVFFFDN